jgi:hypothetical protein
MLKALPITVTSHFGPAQGVFMPPPVEEELCAEDPLEVELVDPLFALEDPLLEVVAALDVDVAPLPAAPPAPPAPLDEEPLASPPQPVPRAPMISAMIAA